MPSSVKPQEIGILGQNSAPRGHRMSEMSLIGRTTQPYFLNGDDVATPSANACGDGG